MRISAILVSCLAASAVVSTAAAQTVTRKDSPLNRYRPSRQPKPVAVVEDGFKPLPRRTPRIIGGSGAPSYPWMAALLEHQSTDLEEGFFCGGSLIHPQWILTAAHCVEGTEPGNLDVAIGGTDLTAPETFQRIPVVEIIVHPRYNGLNSDSDIALLRLAWPVPAGHAATVLLADSVAQETPGTAARVIGWGATDSAGETYPTELREVDLNISEFDWANGRYDGQLTENMLAAGGNGITDSCYGDSGGPFAVFDDALQRWLVTGVVSFGNGCAINNSPGIYSRVLTLRPFILRHIVPGYAAWESTSGTAGRLRDPDADTRVNWEEFLAATNPLAADAVPSVAATGMVEIGGQTYPTASFTVPAYRPEVDLLADFSTVAGPPWQALDPSQHLVSRTPASGGNETLLWRSANPAASPTGFFRLSGMDPGTYRSGVRQFFLQGAITGSLTDADPIHPVLAGTRHHQYSYQPGGEAGTEVRIFLHSGEFDARLELLDAAGGALQTAASNNAVGLSGKDESITFTPAAATAYLLRVTTGSAGQTGRYSLGGFQTSLLTANPPAPAKTTKDALTTSSPLDPLYQPGGLYYAKDYRFDALPNSQWRQFTMDSSPIDAYITLVDAETGLATGWVDDDSNGGTNARLRFRALAGHSYILRCTSAGPDETGAFKVRLTTPSVPNLTVGGAVVKAKLSNSDDRDYTGSGRARYTYKDLYLLSGLTVGSEVTIAMTGDKLKDPYLRLLDPATGRTLAEHDDIDIGARNYNARLTFTARMPECVVVATSAKAGDLGSYTLSTTSP